MDAFYSLHELQSQLSNAKLQVKALEQQIAKEIDRRETILRTNDEHTNAR